MPSIDAVKSLDGAALIAVAGAGRMGAGIAAVAAAAGHQVLLYDAFEGAAEGGRAMIAADWRALAARGKIAEAEVEARLNRIHIAPSVESLAKAVLVIEAIVESIDVKTALFRAIEAVVSDRAIVVTNTSSLSVAALAGRLARPERFAGFHFFNPAPVMPLVEVIGGPATATDVIEVLMATARAWGKSPVRCQATPGFIVNRVARPFYAESLRLLEERAANVETLDAILREAGGFRMGAFELMDMIGHDVNFAVTRSVYEAFFNDPRYKPSLIQQRLVDSGALGRKSGRGFYEYAQGAPTPHPDSAALASTPERIVVAGDLGPAAVLAEMAEAAGIMVARSEGDGVMNIGLLTLTLTDGRTAAERSAVSGAPVAVFDLARDYRTASRIAIALPHGVEAATVAPAFGFFQALGMAVSVIDDAPGLVVMRTVAMLANEALDVVHQGVATADDVDLAMIKGAGHPAGPLATAAQVGMARLVTVLDNLDRSYPEGRYRASPRLRRLAWSEGA